jgi:hypothetical protein
LKSIDWVKVSGAEGVSGNLCFPDDLLTFVPKEEGLLVPIAWTILAGPQALRARGFNLITLKTYRVSVEADV